MNQQLTLHTGPVAENRDDAAELFAQASAFHRAGDLAQAQAGYIEILQKHSDHFDALHMLGISEHQLGNSASAERLLRHCLQLNPASAATRFALGVVLDALQRNDEALACYDDLIALTPDFADAHMKRGALLSRLGRFAERRRLRPTDRARPAAARCPAPQGRGAALSRPFRRCDCLLRQNPGGVAEPFRRAGRSRLRVQGSRARQRGDRRIRPRAGAGAGSYHHPDQSRRGPAGAETERRGARRFRPGDRPQSGPGARLARPRQRPDAWQAGDRALEACHRALAIEPNSTKALTQIGQCHALLGDAEAAVAFYDRALAIKPDDDIALQSRIFSLDFCAGDDALHQAARSEWWRRIAPRISQKHPPRHDNGRDPARKIVLGYVSGDFRHHSSARVFHPVLQHHDKSRFEVICYCNSPTKDDVTASFRQIADRWRDVVQWTDDQLATSIRADQVDILIDLSGHTRGNRLRVFAQKPAPIQVSAWGHGSGTGMPAMDYLFTDPVSVPPEVCDLFAEQICHLPCSIIIEPPPLELRAAEPPMIANGYVTYGVFTRTSRLSAAAIEVWARILRADVTSRLIIKDRRSRTFRSRTGFWKILPRTVLRRTGCA